MVKLKEMEECMLEIQPNQKICKLGSECWEKNDVVHRAQLEERV